MVLLTRPAEVAACPRTSLQRPYVVSSQASARGGVLGVHWSPPLAAHVVPRVDLRSSSCTAAVKRGILGMDGPFRVFEERNFGPRVASVGRGATLGQSPPFVGLELARCRASRNNQTELGWKWCSEHERCLKGPLEA